MVRTNRDICADPETFSQHMLMEAYLYTLQDPRKNLRKVQLPQLIFPPPYINAKYWIIY